MPSVRTTISCRLFAQLLTLAACLLMLSSRTGADPDLARALPTDVTWSITLPAAAAAPPVFGDDHVYVALQSGVVAYGVADGLEAWRRDVRTTAPLAFDGGRLFIASGDAIYALNADGSLAWQTQAGTLATPLLAQDGWVIAAGDQLSAFRASDGSVVWHRPLDPASARPSIEGSNLFVSLVDGRVLALDLETGTPKWERRLRAAPTEVLPFADRVYVGSADKTFYCLDTDDGEVSWHQGVGAAVRGRAAADETRIYVLALDNQLRAFDRGNGALRWSPRGLPFRPTAGPVVIGGLIVVAGATREIRAFGTANGQPAGQLTLPESLATLPAYAPAPHGLRIAAITAGLSQQWQLSMAVSARPSLPSIAVEPLTALPGLLVPSPRPPG